MGKKSRFPTGPPLTSEPLSTESPGFSALLIAVMKTGGTDAGGGRRDAMGEQSWGGGV